MKQKTSEAQEAYFKKLESELSHCRAIAEAARAQGYDPSLEVEIPSAADLADRVEVLMGVKGLATHIRKCEEKMSREEASLQVAADIADGLVGRFDNRVDAIQCAIRTAVAVLTEGVVAAPLEGISQVSLGNNDDGTEYIKVYLRRAHPERRGHGRSAGRAGRRLRTP